MLCEVTEPLTQGQGRLVNVMPLSLYDFVFIYKGQAQIFLGIY